MKEPNQTVEDVGPDKGSAGAWWKVRPVLQVILLAEVLAVVALLTADATSAAIMRAWFRPVPITLELVQAVITTLAAASLLAVIIEAARTGRLSARRNHEGLKVASASS
jgi:hypothetical protein